MNQKQVTNFQVVLFLIIGNGFFINLIGFKYIVKHFKQNSWYMPFLYFLVYLLLMIPYKSINRRRNILKETRNNHFMKVIIALYCFLAVLVTIFYCSLTAKDFFFPRTPMWFLILTIGLCSLYISSKNFTTIIQTSTIFMILSLLLYIAPIRNMVTRPIHNILPFKLEYKTFYLGFLLLLFPLDNLLITFHNTHLKDGLTKKMNLLSAGLTMFYIAYIFFDAITLVGYEFYTELFLGGLFRWQVFSSNTVFENNDIFMLYTVSVGVLFKCGFYLNTLRLILFPSNRRNTIIGIGIIFFIANYFIYAYLEFIDKHRIILKYFLFALIFIIAIYITIQSRRVNKYES